MMKCFVVLLALCGLAAFGQDSVKIIGSSANFTASAHFGPPPASVPAVTGAPYCGELVSGSVQTLADGTHLTHEAQPIKMCRDSFGRTRSERPAFQGSRDAEGAPSAPDIVEITDPVADVRYVLDTQGKIAHRQTLSSPNRPALPRQVAAPLPSNAPSPHIEAASRPADPKAPQTTTEKLEAQVIEGVLAEGKRMTTTWPEGSHLGNDRPVSVVTETWRSPELQLMLLEKTIDPRFGERTAKMTNLTRTEPDPALFQPPLDYTIVDEKEDFTIKWGSGPQ